MDVHRFDGTLSPHLDGYHLSELIPWDERYRTVSTHHNWKTIIEQWGSPANHDRTSNIRAEPLVKLCYEILNHPDDNDFRELLEIQLTEMDTGMCPPGRTTRLYQVVRAFLSRIN